MKYVVINSLNPFQNRARLELVDVDQVDVIVGLNPFQNRARLEQLNGRDYDPIERVSIPFRTGLGQNAEDTEGFEYQCLNPFQNRARLELIQEVQMSNSIYESQSLLEQGQVRTCLSIPFCGVMSGSQSLLEQGQVRTAAEESNNEYFGCLNPFQNRARLEPLVL